MMRMRMTFHLGKFTVTIIIRKTQSKKKTAATLPSDGCLAVQTATDSLI